MEVVLVPRTRSLDVNSEASISGLSEFALGFGSALRTVRVPTSGENFYKTPLLLVSQDGHPEPGNVDIARIKGVRTVSHHEDIAKL